MKVLQMIHDMFYEMPDKPDIHEYFHSKKRSYGGNNRRFFIFIIQYLGGRSYNKFLDYSLFAVKLNAIYDKFVPLDTNSWDRMKEGIEYLLSDDRHDLWQNLPYVLDDVIKLALESDRGKEKLVKERINEFWDEVVNAMIECINMEGTGDQSVTIKYPL